MFEHSSLPDNQSIYWLILAVSSEQSNSRLRNVRITVAKEGFFHSLLLKAVNVNILNVKMHWPTNKDGKARIMFALYFYVQSFPPFCVSCFYWWKMTKKNVNILNWMSDTRRKGFLRRKDSLLAAKMNISRSFVLNFLSRIKHKVYMFLNFIIFIKCGIWIECKVPDNWSFPPHSSFLKTTRTGGRGLFLQYLYTTEAARDDVLPSTTPVLPQFIGVSGTAHNGFPPIFFSNPHGTPFPQFFPRLWFL